MIKFLSDIYVKIKANGNRELLRGFAFRFSHKKDTYSKKIPVGFETDFASVPKVFWSIFPKDDLEYLKSAIVHDFFYKHGGLFNCVNDKTCFTEYKRITRYEADVLFREGAKVLGAGFIKRNILFAAVRFGGAKSWGSNKKIKNMRMNPHKNPDPRVRG